MRNSKSYSVDEAQLLLERFCAYQDRCHAEVEQKLNDLGMIFRDIGNELSNKNSNKYYEQSHKIFRTSGIY